MATVLVVDDSSSDRQLAGGLLTESPELQVLDATDGQAALNTLQESDVDLVVTDLIMPEIDGLELVEAVKTDYPALPVILLTGQGSEEIAVRALQLGAASYVTKRRMAEDLLETVERVLSATQQVRRHSQLMEYLTGSEDRFEIPNELGLIPPLVNYLQQAAENRDVCRGLSRLRLGIALEEALVNAYYHGNLEVGSELRETDYEAYYALARNRARESPYSTRKIAVHVTVNQQEAVYWVRDEGPGFDVDQLPDPDDPMNLERPSGRGIVLMRTFMDDIRFNGLGNEVTLVKRRQTEAAGDES